jgi:hypothetical protein
MTAFERRLGRRNPGLGEASEGAVEAPADSMVTLVDWLSAWLRAKL